MVNEIKTYPVVFKLLATLRMIIDGHSEAAIKVWTICKVRKDTFLKFYFDSLGNQRKLLNVLWNGPKQKNTLAFKERQVDF